MEQFWPHLFYILQCVPFKIPKRLIYDRVESITDSLFPQQQACFRHGRSTLGQVTLLTQDIEDGFSAKMAGAKSQPQ